MSYGDYISNFMDVAEEELAKQIGKVPTELVVCKANDGEQCAIHAI